VQRGGHVVCVSLDNSPCRRRRRCCCCCPPAIRWDWRRWNRHPHRPAGHHLHCCRPDSIMIICWVHRRNLIRCSVVVNWVRTCTATVVFWAVVPFSVLKVYRRFGGTSFPNHRPDDGGRDYLWNAGRLLPDYMGQQDIRQPAAHSKCKAQVSKRVVNDQDKVDASERR
jgi:hypothetical protein